MTTTKDGTVWVAGSEGTAQYRNDTFTIVTRKPIEAMVSMGDYVLLSTSEGVLRGDPGKDSVSVDANAGSAAHSWFRDREYRIWHPCAAAGKAGRYCIVAQDAPTVARQLPFMPFEEIRQIAVDAEGRIWAADGERAAPADRVARRGESTWLERLSTRGAERDPPLYAGRNGQLWFAGEVVRGLSPAVEFRSLAANDMYPPTALLEDSRCDVWVAAQGEGLRRWRIDPGWERWGPEEFGGQPVSQVVQDSRGTVFAGTHSNVFRLDPKTRRWSPVLRGTYRIASLLPLEDRGFLASVRRRGLVRFSSKGELVEHIPAPLGNEDDNRLLMRDGQNQIWVANRNALLRLEGRSGNYRLAIEPMPEMPEPLRSDQQQQVIDLQLDAGGRLWAGYAEGIAWRGADGVWHRIQASPRIGSVRTIALAGSPHGSEIWIAHREVKLFTRALKRGPDEWATTVFPPEGGYGPLDTHFVKRDRRGWIWRGSTDGVYVADGQNLEAHNWLHIGPTNGLATDETDQYGFLEDSEGAVWISGAGGVTRMLPSSDWFAVPANAPAPRVANIRIGNEDHTGRDLLKPLPADTPFRFEFASLHGSPLRPYSIRYRLLPGDGIWRFAQGGRLESDGLAPGNYKLELAHAGKGQAPVSSFAFEVSGGGNRFAWMAFLLVASAGAGLFGWLLAGKSPAGEKVRYVGSKAWFMFRRRILGLQGFAANDEALAAGSALCGQTFLNRYRLDAVIASSRFSTVYEGADTRNPETALAVKVLKTGGENGNHVKSRFVHEIAALRTVQHPGVVQVVDSWIAPRGEPCLAMPLLKGKTLRQLLQSGALDGGRAKNIIAKLGSALAAIHRHGLVHRDLKPENVIVTQEDGLEQPVLIDFGAAGMRGAENELAETAILVGSFYYLAPERLSGQYSTASDVYSFAIMILEILTPLRLAELRISASEGDCVASMRKALQAAGYGEETASKVASILAEGLESAPSRRPPAEVLADRVSSALHDLERT